VLLETDAHWNVPSRKGRGRSGDTESVTETPAEHRHGGDGGRRFAQPSAPTEGGGGVRGASPAGLTDAAAIHDGLALSCPLVARVACAVSRWVFEHSALPRGFYRELTVRAVRSGEVQLKFILRPPQLEPPPPILAGARLAVDAAKAEVVKALDAAVCAATEEEEHASASRYSQMVADAEAATLAELNASFEDSREAWARELQAFVAYVTAEVPAVRSVVAQLARGRARPLKTEPCCVLWGSRTMTVQWPDGAPYQAHAETLSQVNLATGAELFRTVDSWIGEAASAVERGRHGSDAARAVAGGVLVLGRDVNMFAAGCCAADREGVSRPSRVVVLTHCACAYRDAYENACRSSVPIRLIFARKVDTGNEGYRYSPASLFATASRTCRTRAAVGDCQPQHVSDPTICVVTASRRGLGAAASETLRCMPNLQALVYVACATRPLVTDLVALLGPGGFRVVAVRRFDHFPGTRFAGAALLLVRRPPSLVLPVGPAGSGKSSLARALSVAMPLGTVLVIERDAVYAAARYRVGATPSSCAMRMSITKAKQLTHIEMADRLTRGLHSGAICVVDSCNASTAGREYYRRLLIAAAKQLRAQCDQSAENCTPLTTCIEPGEAALQHVFAGWPPLCVTVVFAPADTRAIANGELRRLLLSRVRARARAPTDELPATTAEVSECSVCVNVEGANRHPTFPDAGEPAKQERALDATMDAMEWPCADEDDVTLVTSQADRHGVPLPLLPRTRVMLRIDPLDGVSTDEALYRLFAALFWQVS